ncbi:hypothetical protein B0H14DRAFT_3877569 [Mycena olivaceomarginata]|nr:hypothetical protein B0H14DRAFT_3877569 [Mycena olivaceomarginata]
MPRLSVFDLLHRGVVYSLLGISGWAVFVGVYGHKERKAALMARAQGERNRPAPQTKVTYQMQFSSANGGRGAAETRRICASARCAGCYPVQKVFVKRDVPGVALSLCGIHCHVSILSTA